MQNIIKYIKSFSKRKKRKLNKRKLTLSKLNKTSFTKKRKKIVIKNINFEQLKIFWNNIFYYYLLIFIILTSLSLYIIFWPVFKIKYIEIIKQDNITNMLISYKALENYRWEPIWTPEKKDILKSLQNYQHNIRDIKVKITFPDTLKITIDSYKWLFNTTVNDKTFTITTNGTLIPAQYSEDYSELKIINNIAKSKFLDYKKVFDSTFLAKISNINNKIKENIINLNIKDITYYVIERELHIETEKDTILIFDLNWNTNEQIEKLAILNKEHIDINKYWIMYIDLRITNKVFYCTIEEEYKCIKNLKSIYSNE